MKKWKVFALIYGFIYSVDRIDRVDIKFKIIYIISNRKYELEDICRRLRKER